MSASVIVPARREVAEHCRVQGRFDVNHGAVDAAHGTHLARQVAEAGVAAAAHLCSGVAGARSGHGALRMSRRERQQSGAPEPGEVLDQTRRLSALGTLIASVAHEINNPNNMIQLNAEYLQQLWHALEPELAQAAPAGGRQATLAGLPHAEALAAVPQALADILDGTRRIERLIAQLREQAAPGRGGRAQVRLAEVIAGALRVLEGGPRAPARAVAVAIAADVPPIWADPLALERLVINLVDNALDAVATAGRGGGVRITVRRAATSGVEMLVSDDGGGIAEELRGRIFDSFVSTKHERGGSGLGLHIAREIVLAHRGTLELVESSARGSTFRVALPFELRDR